MAPALGPLPNKLRVDVTEADIAQALEQLDTPLDVDPADLFALFRRVEEAAQARLCGSNVARAEGARGGAESPTASRLA